MIGSCCCRVVTFNLFQQHVLKNKSILRLIYSSFLPTDQKYKDNLFFSQKCIHHHQPRAKSCHVSRTCRVSVSSSQSERLREPLTAKNCMGAGNKNSHNFSVCQTHKKSIPDSSCRLPPNLAWLVVWFLLSVPQQSMNLS